MSYFHSMGIVHRDLKPDNIMIQNDNTGDFRDIKVKLIDFGMAKLYQIGGKKIELNSFCGTLQFLAPEVVEQ